MNRLCFRTYGTAIFKAIPHATKQHVVTLLLGMVLDNETILNQVGEPYEVTPPIASKLLSGKDPVHSKIQMAAATMKIIQCANDYFSDAVLPEIPLPRRADLLTELSNLIATDCQISSPQKNKLLAFAAEETLANFLAQTFLYALSVKNCEASAQVEMEIATTPTVNPAALTQLNVLLQGLAPPDRIPPPPKPADEELSYIKELLLAYADAEAVAQISRQELPAYPKYHNDFKQRRKEYYAAESIRRGMRDIYEDQFELLKEETFDGIFDVYNDDFTHGYARLLSVMKTAATITVNRCVLSQNSHWIGNSEKKGVCHILANEGKIRWVMRDE